MDLDTKVTQHPEDSQATSALESEIRRLLAERDRALEALKRYRKRSQAEARRQRELTSRIIDHTSSGISYFNRDFSCEWANPAQCEMWELDARQVVGRSLFEVFGPETRAQVEALLEQAMSSGRPFTASNFVFHSEAMGVARTHVWDFTLQPVRDKGGQVEGLLILAQEVSQRQERERVASDQLELLKAADLMKDEFLSVVSHELRTPLNFIMGFASILEDGVYGELNAQQAEAIARILMGSDRMLVLVSDLLEFARIRAGEMVLVLEPTSFHDLADDVIRSLQPLADERHLTLEAAIEVGCTPRLDGPRMVQVLTNLIGNAIKFTEPGGQVWLEGRQEGERLIIEVSDSGIGIAEADLPKLFQRFQQLDMSATRATGGTGLGLAICKSLVEAHKGTISVKSERGKGSTFTVSLPCDPDEA